MWSDEQPIEVGEDLSTKVVTEPVGPDWDTIGATAYSGLAVGSAAVAGYYGLKRGGFWPMVGWAIAGFVFPVLVPTVAYVRRKKRR